MNKHNRILLSIAGLALFLSGTFGQAGIESPSLIPYRTGNLWGYARPGGAIVIPPQFEEAGLFSRRLPNRLSESEYSLYDQIFPVFDKAVAIVRKDSLFGLMDESGQFIVEPAGWSPPAFFPVDTNLVWIGVRKKNTAADEEEYSETWSLALWHKSGRILSPFEYEMTIYEESECSYRLPDDPYGNQSIRDQFSCAPRSLFSEYIGVQKNGKQGLIRKDGSVAYPPAWKQISLPRGDGVFASLSAATPTGNPEQWVVAGPGNKVIKKLPPGLCCVNTYARYTPVQARMNNEMGYLTADGEWAFPEKFASAGPFSKNGFAIVREISGAWKVIDSTGQKVIDLLGYDGCQPWRDGYYIQLKDSLFYQHDRHFKKTGKVGLDAAPEDLFYRGKLYRSARLYGKCGLLDEQERVVVPFRYGYPLSVDRDIRFRGDSIFYLMTAGREGFGLLDINLNEIIPCRYSQILPDADQQSFVVRTGDNKFGLYSRNGAVIVPAIYDELTTLSDTKLRSYADSNFQTIPYPDAGVKFVSFSGLTAMQDSKGKTLIPFGKWSNYSVYPESRAVVIRTNTENNHYLSKVYDLSGNPLQEIADAEVQPLNEYILRVSRGDQAGLRNLKTGRELVLPGNFNYLLIRDQPLVRITSWEGRLLGYCDFEGNCYFQD